MLLSASTSAAAPARRTLSFTHAKGSLVVGGNDCGPNEPDAPGGVRLTVTSFFEGPGHAPSERIVLVRSVQFDSNSYDWTYPVAQPFVAVPAWADAVVVRADAHCSQAIQDGYDYPTAELRQSIAHRGLPPAPTTPVPATPTAPAPGATPSPSPATPVSDTATFTG